MNGTGKLIAAFVTGLLLALIGAVAYVKTHTAPAAAVAQQTATVTPPEQPKTLPDAGNVVPPPPVPEAETRPIGPEPKHAAPVHPKRERKHTEVAQNEPPAAPQPMPAPTAASPYSAPAAPTAPVAPAPPPAPVAPPPPPREPRSVTLASGTAIRIRLGQKLESDKNAEGDTFSGTLDAPIIMDNAVIAERGSRVSGRIVTAQKAGRVKGLSELAVTLTTINTTDDQRIAVQTNSVERNGPKSTGKDAAKIGGGAALGAIIGAIAGGGKGAAIGAGAGGAAGGGDVLLTRGKPAVMETETPLTFTLAAPVTITEKINQ